MQPTLWPTFEPSLTPSFPTVEILMAENSAEPSVDHEALEAEVALSMRPSTLAPSDHPSADAAPLTHEPTAPPSLQATESPMAHLTRSPTRLPTAEPTAFPRTPAPVAPGDPPATKSPTLAPTPVPCPGRPPCMDHGDCNKLVGKCSCHTGWSVSAARRAFVGRMRRGIGRYLEDCSEYVLSSAARGNTSELKRQVNGAAQPARLGMCCEPALTSFLIACRPRSCS